MIQSAITAFMSGNSNNRNYITFTVLAVLILGWTVLLLLVSPKEIIASLGVKNGYLVAFSLAVVGAFSSFTPFSIYPAVVTFAAGGLNVLLLGAIAGAGLTVGDSFFYYFGSEAKGVLRGKSKKKTIEFAEWLEKYPKWVVPIVTYFYVGVTPFPNNVLTGALALTGYPFRRIILPVLLGNITLPTLIAYLASIGIKFFGMGG